MKRIYDKDDGSIGVGSLIIFIALMVVAAIAAAVIVGTVSSMRDKAYGAANSAEEVVNGNIWGVQYVGLRSSTTSNITYINISFSVVSDSIDLNSTIIEYASDNNAPVVYHMDTALYQRLGSGNGYGVTIKTFDNSALSNWGADGKYWVSPGELVIISIELPQPLGTSEHASLVIVPNPGAPYPHDIRTPADFGTATAIEL